MKNLTVQESQRPLNQQPKQKINRNIQITNKYAKQYLKVRKYKAFDENLLDDYLNTLASGGVLPGSTRNHKMVRGSRPEYEGCSCFHLHQNICVVYRMNDDTLVLVAIGSHQDLNLTEDFPEFA